MKEAQSAENTFEELANKEEPLKALLARSKLPRTSFEKPLKVRKTRAS
ncbi:MAG: hypothetical protein IPF53_15860 [Blastocatellia bacterium]|nr:hypothetical protein [Blastocatellia bacterium]